MVAEQDHRFSRRSAPGDPHVGLGDIGPIRLAHHLDRGFVHVDDGTRPDFFDDHVDERIAGLGHADHPAGQGAPRDVQAQAGELVFLAIQRERVGVLGHGHMGEQSRGDDALGDYLRRHGRGDDRRPVGFHAFAGPAGILWPDMADDLDLGRHDVELFADFLADADQARAAGASFLRFRQVVDDFHPGQIGRDGPASTFAARVGRGASFLEGLRRLLGSGLFGLVEQGKLLFPAGAGLFLGLRSVDDQVQEPDTLLKLGNMLLLVSLPGGHVGEKSFQRGRIVREGIDVHGPDNMSLLFNLINGILVKRSSNTPAGNGP